MKNEETQNTLRDISKKLNILISLNLRQLLEERSFDKKGTWSVGNLVNYLANFELDPDDIAEITGSPVQSVRTLLTPKRRKR